MKRIVRLAGSGIGLAAEAIGDRKKQRSATTSPTQGTPDQYQGSTTLAEPSHGGPSQTESATGHHEKDDESDSDDSSVEDDEEAWELDEALEPPSYEESDAAAMGSLDSKSRGLTKGKGLKQDELEEEEKEAEGAATEASDAKIVKEKADIQTRVKKLVANCSPPPARIQEPNGELVGPLPCPVVLPQRRPKSKARGFVRAYAPVLMEAGIDQNTFLGFLNEWQSSSKASPWINVIFITAGAVGLFPNPIVMGVTTAIQIAAGTAKELQSRHRSNHFLDEINEQLFKPRGLFALVMAFDPSPSTKITQKQVSLADMVSKYDKNPGPSGSSNSGLAVDGPPLEASAASKSSFSMDSMKNSLKSIRVQSGTTHGEFEMPQSAALIFPDVDEAVTEMGNQVLAEGKGDEEMAARLKNKFKNAGNFVAAYADKRAQAEYSMRYPETTLAKTAPKPSFASRIADPSHPAYSGGLITLLTGGHVNPSARKRDRRVARREWKNQRRIARGKPPRRVRERDATGKRVRKKGIIGRVLKKDVLYFMVVNIPTEREMAQAKAAMDAAKNI